MRKPEAGVCCPGCPHRAAYVVVKDALGRGRGKVFCGDAGCTVVGEVHPAATACPGGMARLLPRYAQPVPTTAQAGNAGSRPVSVCAHFVPDTQFGADDAAEAFAHLADEGEHVILCVLASSRTYLDAKALESLGDQARKLGAHKVYVADPFDTAASGDLVAKTAQTPGVTCIIFASPCAQLQARHPLEAAEVDRISCVGCQRCVQITGCPALSFQPPAASIDANACAGCDLCLDYCRTHVILSPRVRLSPAERQAMRYQATEA